MVRVELGTATSRLLALTAGCGHGMGKRGVGTTNPGRTPWLPTRENTLEVGIQPGFRPATGVVERLRAPTCLLGDGYPAPEWHGPTTCRRSTSWTCSTRRGLRVQISSLLPCERSYRDRPSCASGWIVCRLPCDAPWRGVSVASVIRARRLPPRGVIACPGGVVGRAFELRSMIRGSDRRGHVGALSRSTPGVRHRRR